MLLIDQWLKKNRDSIKMGDMLFHPGTERIVGAVGNGVLIGPLPPAVRPPSVEPVRPPLPKRSDYQRSEAEAPYLDEYATLTEELEITTAELTVDAFQKFMAKHDLPIYSLPEVVTYMDDKAARESKDKAGWQWHPVRRKDALMLVGLFFGTPANRIMFFSHMSAPTIAPASGYFDSDVPTYTQTIPLHALRRIALIRVNSTSRWRFWSVTTLRLRHFLPIRS